MNKKNMSFFEADAKFNLPLFGDADKDEVLNVFDCKPFDRNRDGLFGRIINIVSKGKYGQPVEEYEAEKTDKAHINQMLREYKIKQEREKIQMEIEKQKAMNKAIEEKNKLIKSKLEQRNKLIKLRLQQQKLHQQNMMHMMKYPQQTPAQQAFGMVFGIPQPMFLQPIPSAHKKKGLKKMKRKKVTFYIE